MRRTFLWLTLSSLALMAIAGTTTAVIYRVSANSSGGWTFSTAYSQPSQTLMDVAGMAELITSIAAPVFLLSLGAYLFLLDRAVTRFEGAATGFEVVSVKR
jgi:hypothetical protein